MNINLEIFNKLKTEESIWILYLIIICLSFYSNSIGRDYYATRSNDSKKKYREINIFIFSLALVSYVYYFKDSLDGVNSLTVDDSNKKVFFNKLSLMASTLILISGIILLYIAISDSNIDIELAFS